MSTPDSVPEHVDRSSSIPLSKFLHRRVTRALCGENCFENASSVDNKSVVRNSLIAGGVSGMVSTIALHPLDVLRTKLQTSSLVKMASATTTTVATTSTRLPQHIQGPIHMFRQTVRQGGYRALYTGMTLPVFAQGVFKGTVFTVHNVTLECLRDRKCDDDNVGISTNQMSWIYHFIAGCFAGAVNAGLFVTPVEFVRNQLIAAASNEPSVSTRLSRLASSTTTPWNIIQSSIQNHGMSSLWRGATWSIARDGWGCGWFFVVMHYSQQIQNERWWLRDWQVEGIHKCNNNHFSATSDTSTSLSQSQSSTVSVSSRIVSGGLAGLAYWVAALPLDTVKTWIQSADLNNHPNHRSVTAKEFFGPHLARRRECTWSDP